MATSTPTDPRAYTQTTHLAYAGDDHAVCNAMARTPGVALTSEPNDVDCERCIAVCQETTNAADRETFATSQHQPIERVTMTRNGRTLVLRVVLTEGWNWYEVRRDSQGVTYTESQHSTRKAAQSGLMEAVALFRLRGWEWSASA